jgi:RNA polymerase sigma factor (sigma-70 family)
MLDATQYESPQAASTRTDAAPEAERAIIQQYLQDVRHYPLLTRGRERDLAKQIWEERERWRRQLEQHLLHVPLLLSCRPRLRRGRIAVSALCPARTVDSLGGLVALLGRLHYARSRMRRIVLRHQQPWDRAEHCQAMDAVRADMRSLLEDWTWQPDFLERAWEHFDTAMTAATAHRRSRQIARFVVTLGYDRRTLRRLWRRLQRTLATLKQAKQEMVTANLRLVIREASRFRHATLPMNDLIQEGNIGLMRAVDRFDYRRNLKFSTYAVWWIRQGIRRAVASYSLVRIPEYMRDSIRQVRKAREALSTEAEPHPSALDIARHLDAPLDLVERSLDVLETAISLDQPMQQQTRPFKDVLVDPEACTSHDVLTERLIDDYTQRALASLTPREAMIIRRRFGLQGSATETLSQIGQDLQLSRERVRQIEAAALDKLKRHGAMQLAFQEQ